MNTVSSLLSPQILAEISNINYLENSLSDLPENIPDLNRMLYLEQKHYLADHNLNYTDKMSMAAGVEVRVPLLDPNLVKLAASLPVNFKQKGAEGKWIFKKAMEGILPNDVIYRPKTGFGVPIRSWILGPLMVRIFYLSHNSNRNWFNPKSVTKLLDDNEKVKLMHHTIICLLCVNIREKISR